MTDAWLDWPRYIEMIHRRVNLSEMIPKEPSERGYYEWISSRNDVCEAVTYWLERLEHTSKNSSKDPNRAERLRNEGNAFFKNKDYPSSIQSYTESARYSTVETSDFSLAIANRSAAFFHTCRYKESLEDIEAAVECGYPEKSLWKLHLRAVECYLALRKSQLAEKALSKLHEFLEKSDSGDFAESMKKTISKRADTLSRMIKETGKQNDVSVEKASGAAEHMILKPEDMIPPNKEFPYASEFLVRKTCPIMGRRVVAGKPIKKGDVLFVEKPFAWVPVTHGNHVSLCAHCGGSLNDCITPCRGCTDVLYCSWTCWKDAWTYHRWECPGNRIDLWQQIGVSHLAFKMLLISITTTDLTRFNDVHRLVTNVDKKSKTDLLGLGIASVMLTIYAERYTDFFHVIDMKEKLVDKFYDPSINFSVDLTTIEGKKLYFGSMILRHSLQMLANAYAVTKICGYSDESVAERSVVIDEGQQRIAAASYPSASMLNHSCDPTVINTFWRNWLVVKAIKDVAEGEEIFHCYGPYFKRMSKSKRQEELWNQYSFHCQCNICSDPRFDSYTDCTFQSYSPKKERFEALRCPECSGPSQRLSVDAHRCYDCGTTSIVTFDAALRKAEKLFEQGMHHVDIGEWEAAIPCFEKSLAIREKYMYEYNVDIAMTHDALGQCHGSNGRWLLSISHLEKSLVAIDKRYGTDSIEVANELNKLTDVCFQYLGRTLIRMTGEYRENFIKSRKYVDRALRIVSLTSGHWDDIYRELTDKKEQLSGMLEQLRFR